MWYCKESLDKASEMVEPMQRRSQPDCYAILFMMKKYQERSASSQAATLLKAWEEWEKAARSDQAQKKATALIHALSFFPLQLSTAFRVVVGASSTELVSCLALSFTCDSWASDVVSRYLSVDVWKPFTKWLHEMAWETSPGWSLYAECNVIDCSSPDRRRIMVMPVSLGH